MATKSACPSASRRSAASGSSRPTVITGMSTRFFTAAPRAAKRPGMSVACASV